MRDFWLRIKNSFYFLNKKNFIIFLFLLFGGGIITKLYIIQVKNNDYYKALATGQQISVKEILPQRGDILFSDEIYPIAKTIQKVFIVIQPEKINNLEKFINLLADISHESKEELSKNLSSKTFIKKEITIENLKILLENNFSGWYPEYSFSRIYPENYLVGNITGFVNEDGFGQYGIENYYNKLLAGQKIVLKEEKSPLNFSIFNLNTNENNNRGKTLILTVDKNIQYFAQKALEKAKDDFKIDSGEIIVANPYTGEVLANAVFPSFDPNKYKEVTNIEIFKNPSVSELFEPGSILKPIVMAAGLQEGKITPDESYEDKGFVNLGGAPIYNFHKKVWGKRTMTEVLQNSINTGAVYVEQKIGKEKFLEYLGKFGFFEKTEIDLQREEFSQNFTLRNGKERDIACASFGQGIQINSFHIIQSFSAIANGGKIVKPHFLKKIIYPNGKIEENNPKIKREILSKEVCQNLTSMLINVVENGSGWRTKIKGYEIAGKTGTAQVPLPKGGYSDKETIQSFIGYFPAFEPKIIIFIKLKNPKVETAEYSAVPIFKELAQNLIDYLQIPPNINFNLQ
ncbi:MAG: peptidoglycan D,D-transpeptidase FtsI family protein [Minisyncoccia bacterium]